MFSALAGGAITRRGRRPHTSRSARSRRPEVEGMESRQLLTTYITVNNAKIVEGTGANSTMNFTVSLVTPSAVPVTVSYGTHDFVAKAGSDYDATNGTLTFQPGEMAKVVPVTIIGDNVVEGNETVGMALSNAINGKIITPMSIGTIVDDDTAVTPQLTISDVTMTRGLSGTKTMTFTVGLNTALAVPVTVKASTSNLTAIAGVDYVANSQALSFAPGQTTATFSVTIYGTSVVTGDKFFLVNLSDASVALAKTSAAGIIKYGA